LKVVNEALLPHPSVLNRGPIHEHGDHKGIVDLAPVKEVKASDRVAEDADPTYGGVGTVGHDLDVQCLVEVPLEEDPEELQLIYSGDVLWACFRVSISGAYSAPACSRALPLGEGHELHLCWISLETILVEPLQYLFISFGGGDSGSMFGGGGGVDGTIVNVQ